MAERTVSNANVENAKKMKQRTLGVFPA